MRYSQILEEDYEDGLDQADSWLKKYTYEGLDKWPSNAVIQTLVKRYPVTTPMVIYRGMNFDTREKFEEFVEQLQNNITLGGITSWTTSSDQADQFAVTKPSYFLNRETMNSYGEMEKNKEFVSGYRGIILRTVVSPGHGINVNVSKLGHEDEIILIPGEYHIEIYKEVKQFKHRIDDKDVSIEDVVMRTTKEDVSTSNEQKKFLDYIIHHHGKFLPKQAKEHLYRLFAPNVFYKISKDTRSRFDDLEPSTKVYFHYTFMNMLLGGLFPANVVKECKQKIKDMVVDVSKYMNSHPDEIFEMNGLQEISKFAGVDSILTTALRKHVSAQYAAMEKEVRNINSIADISEKRKALELYTKQMQRIIAQAT